MTPVESDVAIKEASEALEEMNLYEVLEGEVKVLDPAEEKTLPISSLAVFAEPEVVKEQLEQPIDEFDFHEDGTFKVSNWAGKRFYSDYIKAGIEYKQKKDPEYKPNPVVMLFESPGSSTTESSFHNASKFRFHDWPPPKQTKSKGIMGPCRYSCMNGGAFPVFLKFGGTPDGLMEHWKEAIPDFSEPSFVPKIDTDENTVYAYLPVEQLKHHVNDPDTHYHLAGKNAIHLMTQKVRSKRNHARGYWTHISNFCARAFVFVSYVPADMISRNISCPVCVRAIYINKSRSRLNENDFFKYSECSVQSSKYAIMLP